MSISQYNKIDIFVFNGGKISMGDKNTNNLSIKGDNNSSPIVVGDGNSIVINSFNKESIDNICDIINQIKTLLKNEDYKEIESKNIIKDLNLIQEQVNSESPEKHTIGTAIERIKQFTNSLPGKIKTTSELAKNIFILYEAIHNLLIN